MGQETCIIYQLLSEDHLPKERVYGAMILYKRLWHLTGPLKQLLGGRENVTPLSMYFVLLH